MNQTPMGPFLSEGAAGPDVVRLQRCLEALGHSCGRCGVDGLWGPWTTRAVLLWKRTTGRMVTLHPVISVDDLNELGAPRREDYDPCNCGVCGLKWRFGFASTCQGGAVFPYEHDWRWFGKRVTIITDAAELVSAPVTLPSSAEPADPARAALLEALTDPSTSNEQLNAMWNEATAPQRLPDALRQVEALQGVPVGSLTWGETSWGSKSCDACGGKDGKHRRGCNA